MIIGSPELLLSDIMRDLKRHSSEKLHKIIEENNKESRREWLLWLMKRAAAKTKKAHFQLWQPENHPIELFSSKVAHQKLDYLHYNPVEAGFVSRETDWVYSSARDYAGKKGLLDIMLLDPMMM